jgi:ubiquinone/menaquinone biosynthesis C-methylase UbiE
MAVAPCRPARFNTLMSEASTPQADPPERGHRWFAAFYAFQSRRAERRIGPWRRELLAGLRGDVVEIGAGTGANFPHYPPEARVVALEPDPHMMQRAQTALDALGAANIELRQGPAEQLPFADASFDAAVSTLVLCTVRDLPRSLAEIRRVLRPGGELRYLEHIRGDGMLGRTQDLIKPVWKWCSAGCEPNRRTEQALRDARFSIASIEHRKLEPFLPAIIGVANVAP